MCGHGQVALLYRTRVDDRSRRSCQARFSGEVLYANAAKHANARQVTVAKAHAEARAEARAEAWDGP